MTGEITLRGRVLPIGGLKGKIFSGPSSRTYENHHPAKDNEKDIDDIPESVRKGVRHLFLFHTSMKSLSMHW